MKINTSTDSKTQFHWKQRLSAFFLAFAMVLGYLPSSVWAAEESSPQGTITFSVAEGANFATGSGTTYEVDEGELKGNIKATFDETNAPSEGSAMTVYWKTTSSSEKLTINASEGPAVAIGVMVSVDTAVDLTADITVAAYADEDFTETKKITENTFEITFQTKTTAPETPEVVVPVITVSPSSVELEVDATAPLSATAVPVVSGNSYNFTSSDSSVVTVGSSTGTMKGVSVGTATITVTYGNAEPKTVSVTVKEKTVVETTPATVTGITLSDGTGGSAVTLSLYGTKTVSLTATVHMSDGSDATSNILSALSWTGTDNTIAVPSSTSSTNSNLCTYTAGTPGVNVVKVSYGSGAATITSNEFTINVSGITVYPTEISMTTNSVSEEIVVSRFGNATTVEWTSTNTSLLTVEQVATDDENKTATAVVRSSNTTGEGYVQISTSDGPTVLVAVTVSESVAEHIIPAYNINSITPLKFSDLLTDFTERAYEVHGEAIDCLSSVQVTTDQGILYIGYQSPDEPGAGVASSKTYSFTSYPYATEIVFVPNDSFTGSTAIIKYTGVTVGGNTFYGEIHANIANVDDVVTDTNAQEPVKLTSTAFAQVAQNSGKTVDHIVLTLPDENRAVMYYGYKSADNYHHKITQGEEFDLDDIDQITVIPSPGFTGTLLIPYIITATDGGTIIGQATVEVAGYGPEGPVVYNTVAGEYITLVAEDFHTNVNAITGYSMNYITFTLPDTNVGTLYLNYNGNTGTLVTENTAYNASSRSPQISEVSFVPAGGYTGSAQIPFVGYDIQGNSYLGTLEVNVGTQALGDINYTCSAMGYVPFYEGDFNQFSQNYTGSDVDYIYFPSLPSELQGTLLLGKTTDNPGMLVNSNTPYYYKDTPLMSKLAFQPLSTYNGLVTIPFEGKSVSGTEFAGTMTILVTTQNLVRIPYVASHYNPITFDSADFNVYSVQRTQSELDYVKFELPLSTVGTMYYNYTNEETFSSLVNVTTSYFMNQSHFLNSVTFVPHKDFQGTAQINFTGYGKNGQSFSGILAIYVADGGDPLTYYMYSGDTIYLSSSAIEDYCRSKTGASLNYVTISSPGLSQGRLYQEYSALSTAHVTTTNTTRYYKSQSPYISNIAFIPMDNFLGTVQLPFTAYASDGTSCTGTINILVRPSVASDSVYYYSSFSPIQLNEKDIEAVWASEKVDYIQIHNIPTETQGKLYYENRLTSLATTEMKYYSSVSSEGPYIDNMIYAPRAGFSGTMVLSYTATTVAGRTFSGDICVIVTTGQPSLYFSDMSNHLWATASSDYLYFTSVSTGTGEGKFAPASAISRGDFALMLSNAFRFSGTTDQAFSDVPQESYYYNAIHTLRALGITSGYENNFKPEEQISRQDAMVMLSTAMTIANKDVKFSSAAVLNQFSDSSYVASYAQIAFARMVETGVISGSGGKLNPTQNITRAEMAVVLHQAMTC